MKARIVEVIEVSQGGVRRYFTRDGENIGVVGAGEWQLDREATDGAQDAHQTALAGPPEPAPMLDLSRVRSWVAPPFDPVGAPRLDVTSSHQAREEGEAAE